MNQPASSKPVALQWERPSAGYCFVRQALCKCHQQAAGRFAAGQQRLFGHSSRSMGCTTGRRGQLQASHLQVLLVDLREGREHPEVLPVQVDRQPL